EERCISNYGWVPMEGGNFDRPRENRNSLAGPLSIIRLSSSPLDRTPSPTLPEQENGGNKRRRQRCNLVVILVISFLGLILGAALLFCHTRLVRWAYKEATYPGWNAAIYRNHGLLQRSEENVEINPTRLYEKIEVLRFGANRPSIFLHDFKKNITAILDITGRRCFLKALDPRTVVTPNKFMQFFSKIPLSHQATENTIREIFRVGNLLSQLEIQELGSFIITRYCLPRPTYKLIKFRAGMPNKERRDDDGCEKRRIQWKTC
ncbi:hypothetical protein Angca_003602, partial [Angiostrongylus cantonensis]